MSVYGVTYKTLGHTHPGIYIGAKTSEYSPSKKGNPERSLETHKIFHPENH